MDQMTQEPVAVTRTGPSQAARIGLVGVAAAALIAVGLLAAGAASAPSGLLAAADSTSSQDEGLIADGPGFGRGLGFGGIEITAINGNAISLETIDGWTRTITVDADTTYSKSGDTIAKSDLKVGEEIRFRQTLEDDGTWTIDAIAVILPHVGGQVTAIAGSTITVEQRDGTTATIKVTGDTTYTVNGDAAALADVEVEMFLVAEGTENADGSLTATEIRAGDPGNGRGDGPGFGGRHGHGPRGFFFDGDDEVAPEASSSAS